MANIGYARVSTSDQSLNSQLDELRAHGGDRLFAEAASGKRGAHRPEWEACAGPPPLRRPPVVTELSRLGRNTGDLGRLLDYLDEHGIGLQILNLGIDTRTPAGRLIFTITGAVAAMERICSSSGPSPGSPPLCSTGAHCVGSGTCSATSSMMLQTRWTWRGSGRRCVPVVYPRPGRGPDREAP